MNVKEISWDPSKYSFPVIINPQVTCSQAFMTGVTVLTTKGLSMSLCACAGIWDEWEIIFLSGLKGLLAHTGSWPRVCAVAGRIRPSLQAPLLLVL